MVLISLYHEILLIIAQAFRMAPEVNISFASLHVGLTEVPVTTELPAL